jgi:hypothetical protein
LRNGGLRIKDKADKAVWILHGWEVAKHAGADRATADCPELS